MSQLDEMLDEWGFQSKPGSTKGRMFSSRFYHKELKMNIKAMMLELTKFTDGMTTPEATIAIIQKRIEDL